MKNLALFVALVVSSACHSVCSWAADAPGPPTKAAPRIDAAIDSALADREARRPMQAEFTTDLRDAVYAELAPREAGESR